MEWFPAKCWGIHALDAGLRSPLQKEHCRKGTASPSSGSGSALTCHSVCVVVRKHYGGGVGCMPWRRVDPHSSGHLSKGCWSKKAFQVHTAALVVFIHLENRGKPKVSVELSMGQPQAPCPASDCPTTCWTLWRQSLFWNAHMESRRPSFQHRS